MGGLVRSTPRCGYLIRSGWWFLAWWYGYGYMYVDLWVFVRFDRGMLWFCGFIVNDYVKCWF